jgi:hypothetical protein
MIVIVNVKVTDLRNHDYRNVYPNHFFCNDRMDVFKYMLSSYSAMSEIVTKFFFYIEISPEFSHRQAELNTFIQENFCMDIVDLNWFRLNSFSEWRFLYEKLDSQDDNIIWQGYNDDHIFIDSSLEILKEGIKILENDEDELASIYYSHWPEVIKMADHLSGDLVSDSSSFVKFSWVNYDSATIIKKERFRRYWFDTQESERHPETGSLWFRTDHFANEPFPDFHPMVSNFYVPTKELVRHFDGYSHVGDLRNTCPALIIPDGFFERNIKIKYGYNQRFENFVNINPSHQNLYSVDIGGIDYKWSLDDIPLFWRDKITETDINPNSDNVILNVSRNSYFISCAESPTPYSWACLTKSPPYFWFEKHLIETTEMI